MAPRRPKKKSHVSTGQTQSPHVLHAMISAFQSPEGLKRANMKGLYAGLIYLCSNEPRNWCNRETSLIYPDAHMDKCGVKLGFKDICNLCDILFRELDGKFKELFSALHHVSASRAKGQSILRQNSEATIEELALLLRCCLVILILITFDQNLLVEKVQILLSILSSLLSMELSGGNGNSSITFKKSVSRECAYVTVDHSTSVTEEFVASICSLEPSDTCYTFLCVVLEVFADELLVHRSLREFFMLIDSASSGSEMLFACQFGHGNIGSVLEVICAHFVLSVSDGQAFENFMGRLFWSHGEDFRIPEMSLPAALSLLLNPIMLSAPKMFQAYLLILVSETIGICMPSENTRLDLRLTDFYLTAFERSVILYTRLMSGLHFNGHALGGNGSFVESHLLRSSCQQAFESFLQPSTRDKLNHLIANSSNSWDSYLDKMSCRTNSDLVAASIAYVKERICVFDEPYKDGILSIVSCIILRASSDDIVDTVLQKNTEMSPQDICLLASILKLMSSSLLQVIRQVRHLKFSGGPKSLRDVSSCKEYDVIVSIVGCFEHFSIRLPIQTFLHEMMQSHPARHKKSKWMLLHFAGLLSLSYATGLSFLFKDCLFTIMTLLNLFILEEGDLTVLGSLIGSRSESFPSNSTDIFEGALVIQKSSSLISSKIKNIQEMYMRTRSLVCSYKGNQEAQTSEYASVVNGMDSAVSIVEDTEETCSGEIFLKCILGRGSQKLADVDDLSDFIECRPGKDYSRWLRDRQRFRLWKYKKTTTLRWKKKKMTWNHMKGR